MNALLEVSGLVAAYGQVRAIHGIDLRVDIGGAVALIGANGAGKESRVINLLRLVAAG